MYVDASNESIAARGANGVHKGLQKPVVGGVGAAEDGRILGEIKGDSSLEKEGSGYKPAGPKPNHTPSITGSSVYRALYWNRIERYTIAHRVEILHGEAPPRGLSETEWNLNHRGGRSNMSKHTATRQVTSANIVSWNC